MFDVQTYFLEQKQAQRLTEIRHFSFCYSLHPTACSLKNYP